MVSTHIILGIFGLGGSEIFLVLAILLVMFGGKKIPELAKGLGKGIREFKDASKGETNDEASNNKEKK